VRTNSALAQQAYRIGLPALGRQYSLLNNSITEGGEPAGLAAAYQGQRTGITEGLARSGFTQMQQQLGAQEQAARGGNLRANLTPQGVGAQIADQLYSSTLNEGLGRVEQLNKLLALGMGQSVQAGNASVGAGQLQLQGIAGMPQYNSTYASILGGAAGLASAYGGYSAWQAGQPGLQPGAQLPVSRNYSSFVTG